MHVCFSSARMALVVCILNLSALCDTRGPSLLSSLSRLAGRNGRCEQAHPVAQESFLVQAGYTSPSGGALSGAGRVQRLCLRGGSDTGGGGYTGLPDEELMEETRSAEELWCAHCFVCVCLTCAVVHTCTHVCV